MTAISPEEWRQLADAGISEDDVEVVVSDRAASRREATVDALKTLDEVRTWLDAARVGMPVPGDERWALGPQLTQTDLRGAWRTVAALAARMRLRLELDDIDLDEIRRTLVPGMLRREREGQHEDNLLLIGRARYFKDGADR